MTIPLEKTLIVMPAFNEEASVAAVVKEVQLTNPGISCLVVDDGSTDATASEARSAGAHVATLPINLGVGGAMRLGFKYALDHGYDCVVQIDSDGQHDPRSVPDLLRLVGDADIVLGSRFAGEPHYDVAGPRKWAMVVLSFVLTRICRTSLNDTTSGFKATGPRALQLYADHYPAEYLGDTVEALVIAARAGLTIRQVPVKMRPRAGGIPSHNPLRAAAYLGRSCLALIFALARPPLPLPTRRRQVIS